VSMPALSTGTVIRAACAAPRGWAAELDAPRWSPCPPQIGDATRRRSPRHRNRRSAGVLRVLLTAVKTAACYGDGKVQN
jgi:hypothetical protein